MSILKRKINAIMGVKRNLNVKLAVELGDFTICWFLLQAEGVFFCLFFHIPSDVPCH